MRYVCTFPSKLWPPFATQGVREQQCLPGAASSQAAAKRVCAATYLPLFHTQPSNPTYAKKATLVQSGVSSYASPTECSTSLHCRQGAIGALAGVLLSDTSDEVEEVRVRVLLALAMLVGGAPQRACLLAGAPGAAKALMAAVRSGDDEDCRQIAAGLIAELVRQRQGSVMCKR